MMIGGIDEGFAAHRHRAGVLTVSSREVPVCTVQYIHTVDVPAQYLPIHPLIIFLAFTPILEALVGAQYRQD